MFPNTLSSCCCYVTQATCGDKNGAGAGTSAVTDGDCGASYIYDPSKSASPCAGATCDASGADKASAELTAALKSAHAKSGKYAQEKMASLYDEMGLSAGMAGMGEPPK